MSFSTTRRGALGAAALIGAGGSAARTPPQADDEAGWTLPYSTVLPLTSAINGIDYRIYVRPPVGYAPEKGPYPVVLTLDADYSFPIACMQMEHLAFRMDQAPHAIVVSVAYAGVYPDPTRYRIERSRDYTPIFYPTGGYGPETQRQSGGGPAFLRVLTEEVLPLVQARWAADPADRTLVGHSYGGLFASWVLQTRPEAFLRYLIVSPSLWYAEQMILKREAEGGFTPLPRKTYAYLGVGDWEEQPARGGYMVTEMKRFAELLTARGDPNLIVKSRVFEDETHASIFPACFSTGVRHLFRTM